MLQQAQQSNNEAVKKLLNPSHFATHKDHFSFKIENLYEVQNIIEGYNVHVCMVKTAHELEIELQKLNPSDIIMTEPYLDFMRVIEVYEAQRQL